jgi:hypothetical protein
MKIITTAANALTLLCLVLALASLFAIGTVLINIIQP